jgi:hypothetical protein
MPRFVSIGNAFINVDAVIGVLNRGSGQGAILFIQHGTEVREVRVVEDADDVVQRLKDPNSGPNPQLRLANDASLPFR